MKIVIPSSPSRHKDAFKYIGTSGRFEPLSDCDFVDDTHIVCADRQMGILYLIEFDITSESYKILDTLDTYLIDMYQKIELITIIDNTVYTVSYTNTCFVCDIKNMMFTNPRLIKINNNDAYHGICPSPNNSVVFTNMLKNTVVEYNLTTLNIKQFVCQSGIRMKDAAYIDASHIVTLSSDRGPTVTKNKLYDSHILVYDYGTGRLIYKHTLYDTQIDACVYSAPYCYVTCTRPSGDGYLLKCKINDDYAITDTQELPTESFPHGIGLRGALLAYTSYGDSSLTILSL